MTIEMKFVELQTPLFLAGTNHGLKIQVDRRPIKLIYDKEDKMLTVQFNGEVAFVPYPNIASMTPLDSKPYLVEASKPKVPQVSNKTIKAQVSTPQDHVFANGAGRTRDQ
jgi:hypothetical protein